MEHPAPTTAGEHSTLAGQTDHPAPIVAGEHHLPPVESSSGYSPHAPATASSLNDAFVHGHPTTDLARQVADLSTHHVPSPTGDIANADRVVLGKWAGPDDGYIGEARHHGGIYYDTGGDAWDALKHGLETPDVNALGWQVNEQFLQTQMQNGVGRIDYVVDHNKFNSIEDVVRLDPNSFSAMEIRYLSQNAASYGYERVGDSWVRVKGS